MKAGWIYAAALMCSGCIVEDDPDQGEGAEVDMAVDRGVDPDRGVSPDRSFPPARDAQVLRDAAPVPDGDPPPPDMQRPRDQGPVVDAGPGPEEIVFDTLIIFDDGSQDDGSGTSGVDICGASADCANVISATLVLGGGTLCQAEGPGCSTNRTDPNAVLDDGARCDPRTIPSDFASLGTDGQVSVVFDGSVAGCAVTVVELVGATVEAWEAYVCDSDDVGSAFCLNNDFPVHSAANGGTATFEVPAE